MIDPSALNCELILPSQQRTASGERFDTADDIWTLSLSGGRRRTFDFSAFRTETSSELIESWKAVTANLAKYASVSVATTSYDAFKGLLLHTISKYGRIDEIDVIHASSYMEDSERRDALKADLRSFVRKWRNQGLPGISEGAFDCVEDFATRSEKASFIDILTLDPERGPFIDTENQIIDEALLGAFQSGNIRNDHFCICMLFRLYGQRPQQIADLKVGDVRTSKHHGMERATVTFPFAKQINGAPSLAPLRPTPKSLQFALEVQIDRVVEGLPRSEWNQQPLFPTKLHVTQLGKYVSERTDPGFEGHYTSGYIGGDVYKKTMNSFGLISPRTGRPMAFTPRRERHTVGTHLAIRGLTASQIASTLQHADPRSCEAYIQLGTQHHQLMHSKLDGEFSYFAAQFFGELVKSEYLNDFPDSAIIDTPEQNSFQEVGACAAGGCSALETDSAPFACFTCDRFKLSVDAPLEDLLQLVLRRYEVARSHNDKEVMSSVARHVQSIAAALRQVREYTKSAVESIQ